MPFDFIRSIADFIAPQPVRSHTEKLSNCTVIETVNDCGEKRYIEMQREVQADRKKNLDILLSKCKRLLSFVETTHDTGMYARLSSFVGRVRQAMYKGDDISPLFDEFEKIKDVAKQGSKTFTNLSDVM